MLIRAAALAIVGLGLCACNQGQSQNSSEQGGGAQLDSPAPETEPSRLFAAANDMATSTTGQLTVAMTLRLPDASQANADAQEVVTLTGANGTLIEAQTVSAISPATQVEGQTLRSLLAIPVEEPQVLVYRVINETKHDGQGICGGEQTSHVVVWEPTGPGEPVMKVLGIIGGAPGSGNARACPLLEYRRG